MGMKEKKKEEELLEVIEKIKEDGKYIKMEMGKKDMWEEEKMG